MLQVAEVRRNRRRSMTVEQEHLFGMEKLNIARSDIPPVTHIDYSARPNGVRGNEPPLSRASYSLKAAHRLSNPNKYKLQCPGRTSRVHTGGCPTLLHGH